VRLKRYKQGIGPVQSRRTTCAPRRGLGVARRVELFEAAHDQSLMFPGPVHLEDAGSGLSLLQTGHYDYACPVFLALDVPARRPACYIHPPRPVS